MVIFKEDRELFIGKKIRCIYKEDGSVPKGTTGIISFIDDCGTIHVKREDNSEFIVIPKDDLFELADKKCSDPFFRDCHLFYNHQCKNCPVHK